MRERRRRDRPLPDSIRRPTAGFAVSADAPHFGTIAVGSSSGPHRYRSRTSACFPRECPSLLSLGFSIVAIAAIPEQRFFSWRRRHACTLAIQFSPPAPAALEGPSW